MLGSGGTFSSMKFSFKVGLWAAAVLGLCAAAMADPRGARRYLRLRQEARVLQDSNRAAARENQRLSREARALKDNPAAIERAVREELGFMRPGEMVLQLRSPPGPVSAPGASTFSGAPSPSSAGADSLQDSEPRR